MRGRETRGDVRHQPAHADLGEHAPAQRAHAKRRTVHELHHEIRNRSARDFPDVIDVHDVRMRDGGDGFRFAREPFARHGIVRERWRKQLYGNLPLEHGVASHEHHRHAAFTSHSEDANVGRERRYQLVVKIPQFLRGLLETNELTRPQLARLNRTGYRWRRRVAHRACGGAQADGGLTHAAVRELRRTTAP